MKYKILEARIEFGSDQIQRITVLVDCTGSFSKPLSEVRAFFATSKVRSGYMSIPANATVSEDLLQKVAGAGMETVDRDEIFPNWKRKVTN